jgi:hypothetical protein
MRRFVLLATLTLAGCSWFVEPAPRQYSRPAATEEQVSADVEACKEAARSVQQRDAEISHDIGTRTEMDEANSYFDPRLTSNVDDYASRGQYDSMVERCMEGRGYGEPAD